MHDEFGHNEKGVKMDELLITCHKKACKLCAFFEKMYDFDAFLLRMALIG